MLEVNRGRSDESGRPGRRIVWGQWREGQWPPSRSSPPPRRTSLPPVTRVQDHQVCQNLSTISLKFFHKPAQPTLTQLQWREPAGQSWSGKFWRRKKIQLRVWKPRFCVLNLHSEGPDAGHGNDDGQAANSGNSKSDPIHCRWLMSLQENAPSHKGERILPVNWNSLDLITLVESDDTSKGQ